MQAIGSFVLLLALASTQTPPDFSGEWVAVTPPLAGQRLTVTQTAETIRLRHMLPEGEYVAEYRLDGQILVAPTKYSPGGRLTLSAKWENGKLLLTDVSNSDGLLRIQRTVSFDKDGFLILELNSPRLAPDVVPEQAHRHSDNIVEPSRVVYRRR